MIIGWDLGKEPSKTVYMMRLDGKFVQITKQMFDIFNVGLPVVNGLDEAMRLHRITVSHRRTKRVPFDFSK